MNKTTTGQLLDKIENLSARIDVICHNLQAVIADYNNFADTAEMEKAMYLLEPLTEYAEVTANRAVELAAFGLQVKNDGK